MSSYNIIDVDGGRAPSRDVPMPLNLFRRILVTNTTHEYNNIVIRTVSNSLFGSHNNILISLYSVVTDVACIIYYVI